MNLLKKILFHFFITLGCIFFVGLIALGGFFAYKCNEAIYRVEFLDYQVKNIDERVVTNFNDIRAIERKIKK